MSLWKAPGVQRILVLMLTAGLAGCGGGTESPVELVYRLGGEPAQRQEASRIVRERLARVGIRDADVRLAGDELTVGVTDSGAEDGDLAAKVRAVVETRGELALYDWEPNVLGPRCRPAPGDQRVTGGPAAGHPGAGTIGYA